MPNLVKKSWMLSSLQLVMEFGINIPNSDSRLHCYREIHKDTCQGKQGVIHPHFNYQLVNTALLFFIYFFFR